MNDSIPSHVIADKQMPGGSSSANLSKFYIWNLSLRDYSGILLCHRVHKKQHIMSFIRNGTSVSINLIPGIIPNLMSNFYSISLGGGDVTLQGNCQFC